MKSTNLRMTNYRQFKIAALASTAVLGAGAAAASALVSTGQTSSQAPTKTGIMTPSKEPSGATAPVVNPCTLVTLSDAQAITGGAATSATEAPMGPTCVYKLSSSNASITLGLETRADFSATSSQVQNPQKLKIKTHSGICGKLGSDNLFVSLGQWSVLHVIAPCSMAAQFATTALNRLGV